MTVLRTAGRPVSTGGLAGADPLATLGAAFVLGTLVALTDDAVTPAVTLLLELVALRAGGVPLRVLARRGWPLLVSAGGVGVSTVLLAGGDDRWPAATAAVVRVLAVALPGFAVLLTVDPLRLADALVARGRVPAKIAYGTLAALRLLPLLAQQWQTIALARRARGVDAGGNPWRAAQLFTGQVLALLVAAVRRGSRLAVAMEARGFDPDAPRTLARPDLTTWRDRAIAAGGPALGGLAIAVSALLGTLHWVWT